jgi:16S rRNA (uracil1498-N3)-methyltransferase
LITGDFAEGLKNRAFLQLKDEFMRYFFVKSRALKKPFAFIEGSEVRHIKDVLRLKPGDKIRVFDGEGFEYDASIHRFLADRVEIKVRRKFPGTKESPVQMAVAQALLKEKKMDRLLRHLCELGMTRWSPFISERSVPRPGEKRLSARAQRWAKIVKESCKQCQRSKLPEISRVLSFKDVLDYGSSCDMQIVFYEKESTMLKSIIKPDPASAPRKILLILGPEGGFSDQEIENARAAGCVIAGLGSRILRAETAAIAACTLMQFLYGDMG